MGGGTAPSTVSANALRMRRAAKNLVSLCAAEHFRGGRTRRRRPTEIRIARKSPVREGSFRGTGTGPSARGKHAANGTGAFSYGARCLLKTSAGRSTGVPAADVFDCGMFQYSPSAPPTNSTLATHSGIQMKDMVTPAFSQSRNNTRTDRSPAVPRR